MARILFISQPFENLAIEYLSAALKKHGHATDIIIDPCLFNDSYQFNSLLSRIFDKKESLSRAIAKQPPDLIAFSVLTDTYHWALGWARRLKEQFPELPIIFGGIHPTLSPEEVIKNVYVDMICVGEGDSAIVSLADALDKKWDYRFIDSLWIKDKGKIHKNTPSFLAGELGLFPLPDKSIFYDKLPFYSREYLIMASRGCPYACAYCSNAAIARLYKNSYYRRRSIGSVLGELKLALASYRPVFIWFMDDSFAYDVAWLEEFSALYRLEIGLPFFCYLHPEDAEEKRIKLLKDAGCREIGLGVQTINQDTLLSMGRNSSVSVIRGAVDIIAEAGIICICENILGFPADNETDLARLGIFYNNRRKTLPVFSSLRLFPGTKIFESMKNNGAIKPGMEEEVISGKGMSLKRGGTFKVGKNLKKIAALISVSMFLPRGFVTMLLKTKAYRYMPLYFSLFSHYCARVIFISPFMYLIGKRPLYDVGLRRYIRVYARYLTCLMPKRAEPCLKHRDEGIFYDFSFIAGRVNDPAQAKHAKGR